MRRRALRSTPPLVSHRPPGRELTAVGAYIFAGGFTLGVKQHFKVLAHLEETAYGVATMRRNQPEIPVHVGMDQWPLDELRGRDPIDLIYGNPPCAAWSVAGSKLKGGRDWHRDPRVSCTQRHFALLEQLRPTLWAWESVTQAFTVGRELVDELTTRALALGYSVTYLLHNARYLGVPQTRNRFFFLAHKVELGFEKLPWTWLSCNEALRGLNDLGELTGAGKSCARYRPMLKTVQPGETLVKAWDRWLVETGVEQPLNKHGKRTGRPAFIIRRARKDAPSPVVMCEMIHPIEDRFLTGPELARLCGFPPGYEFEGLKDVGQISRGVCPPVGEWLARNLGLALQRGQAVTQPKVRLVDLREPPGSEQDLPHPTTPQEDPVPTPTVTKPTAKAVTLAGTAEPLAPLPDEGSGAFIRRLLQGGHPDQEILTLVHRHFVDAKTTLKDVAWNKNKLKKLALEQPVRGEVVPTRVDPARQFDTTSLRVGGSQEKTVHRDYAAHFFRWGFAGRFVNGDVEVLDVGCGVDLAFISILNHPRNNVPKRYVGVDLNKKPRFVPSRTWAEIHFDFNFLERFKELGQFDLVTNFEVIEHMRKPEGEKLLRGLRACLKPTGQLLLSTPVFNGKAAANHLHEWTIPELRTSIEQAGFEIVRRHGTFASAQDLKKVVTKEELALTKRLAEYYSGEVLACFLAPLYPDASRNNLWVLRRQP